MSRHQERKDEHVALADQFYEQGKPNDFQALRFVHHSLPQVNFADVAVETRFATFDFKLPFYINGMTGGSEKTAKINHDLAIVARETGLAMASGSVSAGLKHPEVQESFTVIRQVNPHGKVFANLGAEHTVENGLRAVDLLKADALQIHVNAPQELVMPEGERAFDQWLTRITKMVRNVGVPVIVKEVGFGMSRETIALLKEAGVQTIDVSGRGGTNFLAIENSRRKQQEFSFAEDWGQSTAISLVEAQGSLTDVEILASGGIQSPLEMLKALALGARACGISGQFLHLIQHQGIDATILAVNEWEATLRTLMTLLGAQTISALQKTDVILNEPVRSWCEARDLSWKTYAQRSHN